ncbi:hypothetical protein C0J52_26050 [Blattella germanica]|nr:hypothetical protein C0J52_26050 [Blattella germanica]
MGRSKIFNPKRKFRGNKYITKPQNSSPVEPNLISTPPSASKKKLSYLEKNENVAAMKCNSECSEALRSLTVHEILVLSVIEEEDLDAKEVFIEPPEIHIVNKAVDIGKVLSEVSISSQERCIKLNVTCLYGSGRGTCDTHSPAGISCCPPLPVLPLDPVSAQATLTEPSPSTLSSFDTTAGGPSFGSLSVHDRLRDNPVRNIKDSCIDI